MRDLNPDILFWLIFWGINMLIFLPPFLIHYSRTRPFPKILSAEKGNAQSFTNLFSRENQDIFRISADLCIISILGFFLRGTVLQYPLAIVFGIYLIFILIFQIANAAFIKIYHKSFSNIELLQYLSIGYKIVRHSAFYQVVILIVFSLLLFGLGSYLMIRFFNFIAINPLSKFTIALLIFLSIIPIYVRKNIITMTFTNKTIPLHFPEIYKIFFKTNYAAYKKLLQVDFIKLLSNQPKTDYNLHTRPNVFIIVIESYGRMVIDEISNPINTYQQVISQEEAGLLENGFSCVSALAASPVSGAGSWIAYSSFLFGINMENQMLFERYFSSREMHDYNHLFRFLQKNGYKNYRVNAVGKGFDGISIPWDDYTRFYAVDEWIHFKDMDYQGQMYGFGPSPPDQYILHKTREIIEKNQTVPYSYFLLTQNSHSPFFTIPEFKKDWKTCNIKPDKLDEKGAKFITIPKIEDYFKSIAYELKSVFGFIKEQSDDDAIYIIFGDHQPPVFDEAKKGLETPVHIISKNKQFLEEWKAHGFTPGLQPETNGAKFNFEGMLSLFIRTFVKTFSTESNLPEYTPQGNNTRHE
jgi:hypothetical protein